MIRSRNLRFAHPAGLPLAWADLHLPVGGVLVISGPSGSGKSSWLALVAGLLRPPPGQLWVAGQDMGQLTPTAADAWRARHIGFLPQQVHLSPALNVTDNLALAYQAAEIPHP